MALESTDWFLNLGDSGKSVILKVVEDGKEEQFYTMPKTAIEKLLRKEIKGVRLRRIVKR